MFAPCEVIRNQTFCWFRNPESRVLESGIQTVESGIQITEESGIQSPGCSGIRSCFINLEKTNIKNIANHLLFYLTPGNMFRLFQVS